MDNGVREHIQKYPQEIIEMFEKLRALIFESSDLQIEEKLWAKLPSYYAGESFVRLIPFKDHINIEAAALMFHKDELSGFKLTPKGMLQIYLKQEVPNEVLNEVFKETFCP